MAFVDDRIEFRAVPGSGKEDRSYSAGLGSGGLGPSEVRPTFRLIVDTIMGMPDAEAMRELDWLGSQITAAEARVLARAKQQGSTDRETENLADQKRKKTKKERKRATKRATAVNNNPGLADHVEDGHITAQQLDDLADADAKTGGAASQDSGLVDAVRNSNGDQSKETITIFVNNHNAADQETGYERQRRLRKVSKFVTRHGTEAIMAEGDKITIDRIWALIGNAAEQLYRSDGGRDLPNDQHPRSYANRMFDAFADHFNPSSGSRSSSRSPDRTEPTQARGISSSRPSAVIVLGGTITDDGTISSLRQYGTGPVPSTVFDRYFCNAELIGMLFDGNGQPLWQGRGHRTATRAQRIALVARDGGCVLCRAHHRECEAHHLMPFNAPGKGKTNVDNMALVCQDCHHRIHDLKQTLYQDRATAGTWRLRNATPNETAPTKPRSRSKKPTPPQRE